MSREQENLDAFTTMIETRAINDLNTLYKEGDMIKYNTYVNGVKNFGYKVLRSNEGNHKIVPIS